VKSEKKKVNLKKKFPCHLSFFSNDVKSIDTVVLCQHKIIDSDTFRFCLDGRCYKSNISIVYSSPSYLFLMVQIRVARRYIFKPKILFWVKFLGHLNRKYCYIFDHLVWFMAVFGIACDHLVFFPILVYLHQEKSGNPGPNKNTFNSDLFTFVPTHANSWKFNFVFCVLPCAHQYVHISFWHPPTYICTYVDWCLLIHTLQIRYILRCYVGRSPNNAER
jgi:hypothetical protein